MKFKENALILEKRTDGPYLFLRLRTEQIAEHARPGQFVNVRVNDGYDPLLRRPFGIMDAEGDELKLLILIRGKGTQLLAMKREGDTVNLIGPLGNGFPIPNDSKKNVYIVGGIGLAPMLFLSKRLGGGTLLFGARSAEMIPDLCGFEEHCEVEVATDNGSSGVRGTVLELLKNVDWLKTRFYVCGPDPMMKAVCERFSTVGSDPSDVEAYLSLETYMGCGFGACKGCVVPTNDGSQRLCCTDGPVFPWNEVQW